jgi:hypothetical protein
MSSEDFKSFVVTDPDILDEGIDISGLRKTTDTSPLLLGDLEPGLRYDPTLQSSYSDLLQYFSGGLPMLPETPAAAPPATGGGGTGDGGQATVPGAIDTLVTPSANTPEEQRLIDAGIGVQAAPGQPVVAPGEIPVTQEEIDAFNQIPVTQPVTGGITGDPIDVGIPDNESGFVDPLGTISGAPVVGDFSEPTTIQGPLSQVQVPGVTQADLTQAAIDEERLAGYTPSFDTSGLTDATPEQRNTIQNILAAAGDNVQGALTELGKIPGAVVDFANQTVDFFGKKLNVGKTLASIALNKIAGGPVSLLFDILPQDSLENRTTRSIVDELKAEKDYGFNVQTGTLNQDPFGRNPVSQFGNYEQTLTEDINNPSDTRMGKAKKEFAQDYFDKKAEKAGGVEVDEGTVLGPGEAPGDVVSLEDLQAEKDAEIAAQNELAKLTGDVDTFDTTPADTTNIVDEVALTGGGGEDRDPDPAPSAPVSTAGQAGPPSQRGGGADIPDRGRGTVSTAGQAGPPSQRGGGGDSGGDSGGGGGGKIVCTMMNESYGFGSFRNKIWLRHSKGLAPEYQKGYHKIFLPLVKLSKKNIVLKKILEHIAVHRTIDIRQESRGKVHLLGRVYRKILEPVCYFIGKHG